MRQFQKIAVAIFIFCQIPAVAAEETFTIVNYSHMDGLPFIFQQATPEVYHSKAECEQELISTYLKREAQALRVVRDNLVVAEGLGGNLWGVKGCIQIEKGGW